MRSWITGGAVAVVLIATASVMLIVVVFGGADAAATALQTGQSCTVKLDGTGAGATVGPATYSAEQVDVARTIIAVVAARGLPERASVIALATGLVESNLRNLDHGDRDSLGVFQQRPSMGWGTAAQVQDVAYATGTFLDHLVRVPNWQTIPEGVAAQIVQISEFGGRYQQRVPEARVLVGAFAGTAGANVTCTSTGPAGHGASVLIARAKTGLGLPYCYAGGNADGPTEGVATNGSHPGPNGLSPGCDDAHPGYDCSGLTLYALAGVGITVPHLASSQYTAGGSTLVPVGQAEAGDLLFWSSDGSQAGIHHVAISLGGGQLIEAPHDGEVVSTRTWSTRESELMPFAARYPVGS